MRKASPSFLIVVDNIDSLSATIANSLFDYIEVFHEEVVRARTLWQENCLTKSDEKSLLSPFNYVLATRTAHLRLVQSVSFGTFSATNAEEIQVESDLDGDQNAWLYVETFFHKQLENRNISRNNLGIKTKIYGSELSPDDHFDFLIKVISEFKNDIHQNGSCLRNFCGRSIRRYKIFGLKILGHTSVIHHHFVQAWTRNANHENQKRIADNALFDVMQPIVKDNTPTISRFFLHPYNVLHDINIRKKNPLIGIQFLWELNIVANADREPNRAFAHDINVSSVVQRLMDLGYSTEAIAEVFEVSFLTGLIRPDPLAKTLIDNASSPVKDLYILDMTLLDKLAELTFPESGLSDEAIAFMNSGTRANYGFVYHPNNYGIVYEMMVNLVCLEDIYNVEMAMMHKTSNLNLTIPPLRYSDIIADPVFRKWGGVLKDIKVENLHKNDQRIIDLCRTKLSELQRKIRK